jgi:tRNA (adenine22-N1)-methyltransferase
VKRRGRARREALVALVPPTDGLVVDVGADHGHVAAALGAIASERLPGIPQRDDLPWVIADGLAPYRDVDVAVIAGMGARTIAGILERGPAPRVAVLHAQDDPPKLRQWLVANGWRIDAESLAPEAGRYAELVRAVRGEELATGEQLALGPRLLGDGHPLLVPHLRQILGHWVGIRDATEGHAPERHDLAARRVAAIEAALVRHDEGPQ